MRIAAAVMVMLVLGTVPAHAQRDSGLTGRPRLPAGSDTNSARVYGDLGVFEITHNPRVAAAAFYWAARLNPEAAFYPYGRWVALILDDPTILVVPRASDSANAARHRAHDSLITRAYILDPFLHPRLDDRLYIEFLARRRGGSIVGRSNAEVERLIRRSIGDSPDIQYFSGNFAPALQLFARLEERQPASPYPHLFRARAFYLMGSADSARAEMSRALALQSTREADTARISYESKAAWLYQLGHISRRLGDTASARDAYERAIVEDLSYYPAHIQLGLLRVESGDTAGGLREFARALDGRDGEYLPHATYAVFLAGSGRLDSATAHLRRAIEIEPWASQPLLNLGAVLEARGDAAGALGAFEGYLARAARDDPDRIAIAGRVQQMRASRR